MRIGVRDRVRIIRKNPVRIPYELLINTLYYPYKTSMNSPASSTGTIHKDMLVADIVALCPEAQGVLAEYGLHCFGCEGSAYETLGQGCLGHGFEDSEINELVDDLNTMIREMPEKPTTLTVTLSAAEAIRQVAEQSNKAGEGLLVTVDGHGGFCMEFQKDQGHDEKVFFHPDMPDVRIFATSLTLKRIGGATIDFREERFKLDLLDEKPVGCGCGGSCKCGK